MDRAVLVVAITALVALVSTAASARADTGACAQLDAELVDQQSSFMSTEFFERTDRNDDGLVCRWYFFPPGQEEGGVFIATDNLPMHGGTPVEPTCTPPGATLVGVDATTYRADLNGNGLVCRLEDPNAVRGSNAGPIVTDDHDRG